MLAGHVKVVFTGTKITRDTVKSNEFLLDTTIAHIGTRVCVSTLELHIKSFFGLLHLGEAVSSNMSVMVVPAVRYAFHDMWAEIACACK